MNSFKLSCKAFILVAILVLMTSCSGGGGSNPTSPSGVNLTGNWTGAWRSTTGVGGNLSASLTQSGSSVSGTFTLSNSGCFSTVNITGSVSGSSLSLSGPINLTASNIVSNAIGGNYSVNFAGLCNGDTGSFSLSM
jgi:hypothetical protein